MPHFSAPDGTRLAYRSEGGGGGVPLLCLPGGAMRASDYLGDLGGLSAYRRLVLLDLRGTGGSQVPADPATYRCDRQVDDVEALREHLGLEGVDLLAHSAAGDLAILYAARYPGRLRTLTLVAARARALGVGFLPEHRREAAALRVGEPWFEGAHAAYLRIWGGSATDADFEAGTPFFYGRWDAAARAHAAAEPAQINDEAADVYASAGAFADPAGVRAAVAGLDARVLVLAGELDGGPLPRVAATVAGLFPGGEVFVQPGAGHFPWVDDPDLFAGTVGKFLAS
ncbi:alpha/beta hydrolase [Streptomyces sp. NBC_00414]|uniref:alpha/beta fold hydrolase n=1 Tax=Streptomyces sp. NBC_00414 TaxID=2975739 RepID=UPI002E1A6EE3